MKTILFDCRQNLHLFLICTGLIGIAPAILHAQETPQVFGLRAEAAKESERTAIGLRPNTSTTIDLFVHNPGTEDLRNVIVKLVQLNRDQANLLAQTQPIDKLLTNGKAKLLFSKVNEKKDAKDKKDGPDTIELAGPLFAIQFWVEATLGNKAVTIKQNVDFVIKEPRDYLAAQAHYDQAKRKVAIKVQFGDPDNVSGPPKCPLQLVLGPELAAGKNGTFVQALTGLRQAVDLFAEDLRFAGAKIGTGRVSLTVDGYERAFTYPVTLNGSGDLDELSLGARIGGRIRVPRYAKPAEDFPVFLEMDGPISSDFQVEVALDRAGMKSEYEIKQFIGLRQQKIGLSFSPAGYLVCHTTVRDWQTTFDTKEIYGDIFFRVSVFKKGELVSLLLSKEARPSLATQEPSADSKRLFARVTQDDLPPQDVQFVDPPKVWFVGKPLAVTVKVKAPKLHQAPIERKVVFFRGKAPKDGAKIDPGSVIGYGEFEEGKSVVNAVLPAPDKAEEMELSVQLTTAVGVPGVKTVIFPVLEAKSATCTIKGKVAHGMLAQPNLTVFLGDAKGKVLATAKTNAEGGFVFGKVAPGSYLISATVNFPALIGVIMVAVPEGKELIENVAVRLLAK